MRIRSIKPEFWSSEDIAALDWPTRLLFVGLWSYVDDNGVGRDVEKLITASLFALEDDPRDTLATVSRGLQTLSDRGQITRYTSGGKPFLYINAWSSHQKIDKPAKARYPVPPGETGIRDTLATVSRHPRDDLAPGSEEQGNRGTEEQRTTAEVVNRPQVVDARGDDIDLERIKTATKGDVDHARRVAAEVLSRAGGKVNDPTGYVLRAIGNEPERYRAPRGAPRAGEACPEHPGNWRTTCSGCAADRKAAS